MCDCNYYRSMDMITPRNVYLSAFYKRSFAFHTVKNRMPVILTGVIDNLARNKEEIGKEYGNEGKEELKVVIGELAKLNYEIQTNKPLAPLIGDAPDIKIYNDYIEKQASEEGAPTHFHTIWLLTECYMYRRIKNAFEKTNILKDYDVFREQKIVAFKTSFPLVKQLSQYLLEVIEQETTSFKDEFISFIKLNLWGNKCDLSISLGQVEGHSTIFDTQSLEPNVLVDHSEQIFEAVSDPNATSNIVDIVLDNSGYEVITDFCLADFLITKNLAKQVRFYVKSVPWFISDVMTYDFNWVLNEMRNSFDPQLKYLGQRWINYMENDQWTIEESDFWTLPLEFKYMASINPELYNKLAEAKLVIFKGDLNYRKLFGEMNWDPMTSVEEGLQGFHPSKLAVLRTIKADIVCGIEKEGLVEEIEAKNPKWMETGDYGLIEFCEKIVKIV